MEQIKLNELWISDTSSDPNKNKVYKTTGFKINFQKDRYHSAEETYLILNDKKELRPVSKY